MSSQPIAILTTGMVTGVGLSAPASCAAIRAGIDNMQETRFMDSGGEWIMGSAVPLEEPWRGTTKLAKMLAMVIDECVSASPKYKLANIPVLVGLAEPERPGRLANLEAEVADKLRAELGMALHPKSSAQAYGRVAGIVGLMQARKLIYEERVPYVIVAGVDSLLVAGTLNEFDRRDRLLTSTNSNGFRPGEGAAAILVGAPVETGDKQVVCLGFGTAVEKAHIASEIPLRADGLTDAMKKSLADAGCNFDMLDYRITDVSGEQYAFKEAALAMARVRGTYKKDLDIWHAAEVVGETGAASALLGIALFVDAARKAYSIGDNVICHGGNDDGRRASTVVSYCYVKAA